VSASIVERLSSKLDTQAAKVRLHEQRYVGDSPIAFLSPESRAALGNRLSVLNLNYCKLAVDALAERIKVAGFIINGASDAALWQLWRDQEMEVGSLQAITDALMTGRGFISVWANDDGPLLNAEAPSQCLIERDPLSRAAVFAFKRWVEDGRGYSVLYERDQITTYATKANVTDPAVIPSTGWEAIRRTPNPLGAIPLVQLTNKGRTSDAYGVSEMDLIKDANDALVKVFVDQLTTSEAYSRPRRHVAGLQIQEDAEGNPIDPFANNDRTWIAEAPDTKFGQFSEADLAGYDVLTRSLLNQISSLSGLPAHYLLSDQQPTSGEEVRAKEISLVARAESKLVMFGHPLAQVAKLAVAVRDGKDTRTIRAEVSWSDPATRTLAQEADAIVKLSQGDRPVLPISEARARLGYSPEQIKALERSDGAEAAFRFAESA
jgi:hypothetical protein